MVEFVYIRRSEKYFVTQRLGTGFWNILSQNMNVFNTKILKTI